MDHPPLVERDVENGKILIARLSEAGVPILAAFWFYYTDREDWKLVVVTPDAERGTLHLYTKALAAKVDLNTSLVQFSPPSNAVFKALGRYINSEGREDVRLKTNMLDGFYVEDALIYRLAA
jgi:hypothetical protein